MPLREPFEPFSAKVRHDQDGEIELTFRPATSVDAKTWQETWQPALVRPYPPEGKPRADGFWPWARHIERASEADRLVIAVAGQRLEGLLSLSAVPARRTAGATALYIEYVGVAPDNQPAPVGRRAIEPRVGHQLLILTLRLSLESGYPGGVALHSKGGRLDDWYSSYGFLPEEAPEETEDGSWLYFECTAEAARQRLEEA